MCTITGLRNELFRTVFCLVCVLLCCNAAIMTADSAMAALSQHSNKAGVHHVAAMDQILSQNHQRNKETLGAKKIDKRENVEDTIIQVNQGQHVAHNLVEGDIVLDPNIPEDVQLSKLWKSANIDAAKQLLQKRQATRQMVWLWHNKKVPYVIHPNLDSVKYKILKAIEVFNSKTCVKFVPKTGGERDYVLFDKRQGCYSRIGRAYSNPGQQVISIAGGCEVEGIIIHEMLHAVGFYHEQSRPDRRQHLEIHWENIAPGFEDQFHKYSHGDIDYFGINYNYRSVMHYGRTAFSKSSKLPTMEAISNRNMELGGVEMSNEDIAELDALYHCTTSSFNSWTNWGSFGPCDKNCYKSRQRFCYGKTPTSCGGNTNPYGIDHEAVKCSTSECPAKIDGNWAMWSPWADCSRSCDDGTRLRKRSCDNPVPKYGGKDCVGVKHNLEMCIQPRCSLGPYDTDFRNGRYGIWQNNIYDVPGFDWTIGKGPTRTESTGPPSDHTNGKDYYLYIESSGRQAGEFAQLKSTLVPKTAPQQKCLTFFYHMVGVTIGSLALYLNTVDKAKQDKIIFLKTGNQGNEWKPASLTLNTNSAFQLTFEAKIANTGLSDIAIDDVFIDNGPCDCQDKYRASCKEYLGSGQCIQNYDFMFRSCPRSCNFCGCQDTYDIVSCTYWTKAGECKRNFKFMFPFCKRSCQFCDCKDNPKYQCSKWSKKECEKNPLWMEVNCPVLCELCDCYDRNVYCPKWKSLGECTKNRKYMAVNCPKSCQICSKQSNVKTTQ